jgi:ribosomal protein L24E
MQNIRIDDLRNEKIEDNKHKLLEIKLILDNPNIRMEQIYFWLVDFIRDSLKMNINKLSDDFTSSVGSVFFGEMGQRLANVLNNARSLAELINTLTRTIISILNEYKQLYSIYVLYENLLSKKSDEALASYLALKDRWLSNVDSTRGAGSLRNLQASRFPSIVDLFFLADLKSELEKFKNKKLIGEELFNSLFNNQENTVPRDLNELLNNGIINRRIYNLLNSRLIEFYSWLENNKKVLYDRLNLLKSYLKHELSSLLYYVEFAKPYFKFARKLLQNPDQPVDVVNAFETAIINISLIANQNEIKVKSYDEKEGKEVEKSYIPLYEIDMKARAIPTIVGTGRFDTYTRMYSFLGRIDITLRAYLVEKEEYDSIIINQESEDLTYITGLTDDYIKSMSDLILETFLYDIIKNDENLLKIVANKSNAKPEEIKNDPYKIRWTKELVEELEKDERIKRALSSITWIKKYLESEKKEESKNIKGEDNKEKKEEKKGSSISLIFPILGNIIIWLLKFISTFGKDISNIEKNVKKKVIEEEAKPIIEDTKEKTIDTAWKIYMIFKKTFNMLNY